MIGKNLKRFISALYQPEKIILYLEDKNCFNIIPDKMYLEIMFWARLKYRLKLTNPQTFNEKLQWLKLYDRKPEYTIMVDKYEVKKYVASLIGENYVIPTIGVWERFEDIDFDKLPNQFVLKCTHDSGGLVICRNKKDFNFQHARQKIDKSLRLNYYYHGREWPYKDVIPRIIAEEYISGINGDVIDYKVHNFNGEPKIILACSERFSASGLREDFFDTNWNHLELNRPKYPNREVEIPRPETLEEMLSVSRKLSKNIPFVRTDFYEVNGKLLFGEITFFPSSGFEPFAPEGWDLKLGQWITLPNKKVKG